MATLPTIAEVRKMSVADLRAEVATIRREAAVVRLGTELSKEKDTSKIRKLRRHMAQLLTVLQEKVGMEEKPGRAGNSATKPLSKKSKASTIPARA
ncbi:50S ribosomal protein L29 [Candidatus Peribacteria bacterium]|nr:50S ribosomal protein L29 [Candidatus Peribacteria bacterium]